MATVISRKELERMRAMAYGSDDNHKTNPIDEEKHKLSQERMNKWPNTLMAIRKKKENFAMEKILEREKISKMLDIEEEKLRTQQRQEALDRAANLIFVQTDNMKLLKSQKLLSDVLYTREQQAAEKKRRAEMERMEKQKYEALLLAQLEKAELLEKQKIEERKRQIELVADTRIQQLNEAKRLKEKERIEMIKLGEQFKEQAKLEFVKEMKKNEDHIAEP